MKRRLGLVLVSLLVAGCAGGEATATRQQAADVDARDALIGPPTVARLLGPTYDGSSPGEEPLAVRARMFRSCDGGLAGALRWLTRAGWGAIVETSTTSHQPGRVAGVLSAVARFRRPPSRGPAALTSLALKRCGVAGRTFAFSARGARSHVVEFVAKPAFAEERIAWRVAAVRSGRSVAVVVTGLVAPSGCRNRCPDRRLLSDGLRRARRVLRRGIRRPSARPRFGPVICRRGSCRAPRTG